MLDHLLEDGRLESEAASGTSSGGMNAIALAHGSLEGGWEGARVARQKFWTAIAASIPFAVVLAGTDGRTFALGPACQEMFGWASRFLPEQLNPFGLNPLREIVNSQIDFARLRALCQVNLFVAATNAN